MNFLTFGDKENQSVMFIHGMASTANLCYGPLLDAAFLTKMGVLTKLYENIFCKAISRLQRGKKIPKPLMDRIMGKDNNSVVEMLYTGVTQKTITNVCEYVYRYDIPEGIRRYTGQTVFWYGSNEPYPRRSAELLKGYLPKLEVVEFENMGHGQYLHEHSAEYAAKLIEYLKAYHY